MKNIRRKCIHKITCTALAVAVLCTCMFASGCADTTAVKELFCFDTYVTLTVYSCDFQKVSQGVLLEHGAFSSEQKLKEEALSAAADMCKYYDNLWDKNLPDSDISMINNAGGEAVAISSDTAALIEQGLYYSQLSDGVFDITCGAVTALWDFSQSTTAPDAEKISNALQTVDYRNVKLDGFTVQIPHKTKIDVGAIAKGYIADRLCELMKAYGVTGGIINLGGNIYAVGDKSDFRDDSCSGKGDTAFSVGIRSPFDQSANIARLEVSDCSVVTAGAYERGFEADGRWYHHILDLSSGMPAESGLASVTIICKSSACADALSTICFILGQQKGMELVGSIEGVEAVFVESDGTVTATQGAWEQYALQIYS